MKKYILTILFSMLCYFGFSQYTSYSFNAGQKLIFDRGTTTIERSESTGGVIAYKNHVEVVDTIFHKPLTAPEDTIQTLLTAASAISTDKRVAILIEKGDTLREQLNAPRTNMYFGWYGTGSTTKPIINGSNIITDWSQDFTSEIYPLIYKSDSTDNLIDDGTFESYLNTTELASGIPMSNSDETASWVLNQSSPISGTNDGMLTVSSAGTSNVYPRVTPSSSGRVVGQWRKLSFNYKVNSGTCIFRGFYSGAAVIVVLQTLTGSGEFEYYYQCSGTSSVLSLYFDGRNTFQVQLDDIKDESFITNVYTVNYTKNDNYRLTRNLFVDDVAWELVGSLAEVNAFGKYYNDTVGVDKCYAYSTDGFASNVAELPVRDYGIYVYEKSDITIRNLEFVKCDYAGVRFYGDVDNANCLVDNCEFYWNYQFGVGFRNIGGSGAGGGFNGNTVSNCISNFNGNGYYTAYSKNNTFINNSAHGNYNHYSPYSDGHGVGIAESDSILVEYCELDSNRQNIAIDMFDYGYTTTIRYNELTQAVSTTSNINIGRVGTGGDVSVYYNLMVDSYPGGGFTVSDSTQGNIYFYNNTVYESSTSSASACWFSNGSNIIMKNNLISTLTGANGMAMSFGDAITNLTSNYNLYYAPSADSLLRYNDLDIETLSDWQTLSSQDANSLNQNPLFVGSGDNPFSLQSGSPAINAGTDVGLTTDILGNPIVGNPDIGAYEKQ